MSVVQVLKEGLHVMQVLHSLWVFVVYYDIELTCVHIMGAANSTTNHLPHNNMTYFFSFNPPGFTFLPTKLPSPQLQIVVINSSNSTSLDFRKYFKATITKIQQPILIKLIQLIFNHIYHFLKIHTHQHYQIQRKPCCMLSHSRVSLIWPTQPF